MDSQRVGSGGNPFSEGDDSGDNSVGQSQSLQQILQQTQSANTGTPVVEGRRLSTLRRVIGGLGTCLRVAGCWTMSAGYAMTAAGVVGNGGGNTTAMLSASNGTTSPSPTTMTMTTFNSTVAPDNPHDDSDSSFVSSTLLAVGTALLATGSLLSLASSSGCSRRLGIAGDATGQAASAVARTVGIVTGNGSVVDGVVLAGTLVSATSTSADSAGSVRSTGTALARGLTTTVSSIAPIVQLVPAAAPAVVAANAVSASAMACRGLLEMMEPCPTAPDPSTAGYERLRDSGGAADNPLLEAMGFTGFMLDVNRLMESIDDAIVSMDNVQRSTQNAASGIEQLVKSTASLTNQASTSAVSASLLEKETAEHCSNAKKHAENASDAANKNKEKEEK